MDRRKTALGGYEFTVFRPDEEPEGAVYLPMHGTAEELIASLGDARAAFIFISGFDWNKDLSPWPARAVFGGEDFSGGADAFQEALIRLLPDIEREAGIRPVWRGIAGYSLAGLFAVYAAYRCDVFTRVASVSGSMWYDGWLDYARGHFPAAEITRAYFSVGAKEKKTRNLRMASVEDCTRATDELFRERGVRSIFELNPGNHFVDADRRMLRALQALLE